ncbi:short-chain dehydrogenase/reductase SDR [Hyaloraphidium curvatum]|nr:short-chain dehydrogenase/reductase SDR [Hyaloraphidium curvatum]
MPTALITGCSSGFGEGAALALARAGYTVYAGVRETKRAARLAETAAKEKLPITIVEFDVRDGEKVKSVVADIEAKGPIDLLVPNAGRHLIAPLELSSIEDVSAIFDINVFGVLRLCQAVLPGMRKRRAGRIVVVTSGGSFVAVPNMAAYTASKHALDAMCAALANEVKPFGITVATVAPGTYRTAMTELAYLPKETYNYSRFAGRQCVQHIKDIDVGPDPGPVFEAILKSCTEPDPPLRRLIGCEVLQPAVDIHDSYQAWFAPKEDEVPE